MNRPPKVDLNAFHADLDNRYIKPRVLVLDELGCAPRGAKKPCGVRDPPGAVAAAP